jgi:flavin reductase (DIM6/NTAB) family NADH-FMN oxidoreductase RutF
MPEFVSAVTDPSEGLKAAFRRHASGVAVITLLTAEGDPVGFTATSVTSLGSNPPLVSFNVARGSSTWPHLLQAKHVAIHTLGATNLELAQRMAADHTQRFVPNDWQRGPHELPVFPGATSALICKVREVHNVENNAVIIVAVEQTLLGEEDDALLYHQRHYLKPGESLN